MCHSFKNKSNLINGSHLEKWLSLTQKKVSQLEKCVTLREIWFTLRKMAKIHLEKCVTVRKMGHSQKNGKLTQKNVSQLELQKNGYDSLRKMCHTYRKMATIFLEKCFTLRKMAKINLEKWFTQKYVSQLEKNDSHLKKNG